MCRCGLKFIRDKSDKCKVEASAQLAVDFQQINYALTHWTKDEIERKTAQQAVVNARTNEIWFETVLTQTASHITICWSHCILMAEILCKRNGKRANIEGKKQNWNYNKNRCSLNTLRNPTHKHASCEYYDVADVLLTIITVFIPISMQKNSNRPTTDCQTNKMLHDLIIPFQSFVSSHPFQNRLWVKQYY